MENERLLEAILEAIYWQHFTLNQKTVINNIIKYNGIENITKANLICEFLDIEKRHNRSAIKNVLESL